ncbi:hypothetical protein ACE6H2_014788 [Prunus campanulata]
MDPRLYKSAESGDVCFLKQLLNDDPMLLYQLTPRENTALHIAVQFGHKNVTAEIYSRCRSLLTQPNLDGDTPLHVAARVGRFSIVNYLVRETLSMSQVEFGNMSSKMLETLRVRNRGNNTVLHEAVRNGHNKVAEFLLKIDPKLACFENEAGESPLYLAAREGLLDILNQILQSSPSSAHGGSDGQTALHAAVVEKHFGMSHFSPELQSITPSIWGHLGTRHSGLGNIKISPRADQEEANAVQTYMQMGQTLLMVATLITTVTFAAAFTMPGGYNNDVGPDRGQALLQSNNEFKWFIITDTVAMTCSIIAACLLFWGAVNSNKSSYVYYFTSAAALTYIALQSTAIAFETGIKAAMPDQQFLKTLGTLVGAAFHVITFLALSQLVKMFSLPEACRFFISHLCKLKCKIKNKP